MKIEVFSGPGCGYCMRAKALLDEKSVAYTDLDISEAAHRDDLARRLPRVKSIPQIFIDSEHIGGFEDLESLAGAGRLDETLGRTDIP